MLVKVEEKSQRCHIKKNGGSILVHQPVLSHGLAFDGDFEIKFFKKFHLDEESIEFVVVVVRIISFLLWHHKRIYTF